MDNITVEELKKRLDAGEKLNIVDVREPHENAEFNIGGVLIPWVISNPCRSMK